MGVGMSIDAYVTLKIFTIDREMYEKYHNCVRHDLLAEVAARAIDGLGEYYQAHPKQGAVTLDAFELWYVGNTKLALPMMALTRAFLQKAREAVITADLIEEMRKQWVEHKVSTRLQDVLNGVTGNVSLADHIEQARDQLNSNVVSPVAPSMGITSPLLAPLHPVGDGYEWSIEELNIALGPARRGDFILVGACYEMGKTSFCLSQAIHWIIGAPPKGAAPTVLILNNEEETYKLRDRCLTIATGMTGKEIEANRGKAFTKADKAGVDDHTLTFQRIHGMTARQVERIVDEVNPCVVIINRLDKVNIREKRDDSNADRYGNLGLWARNLAATGRLVLGIVQVGSEAAGLRKVYGNHIYGSKTLIQGEADAIILLGGEGPDDPIRGINIPKNKLVGGPRSIESSRHAYCEVTFDAARCVFKGGTIGGHRT